MGHRGKKHCWWGSQLSTTNSIWVMDPHSNVPTHTRLWTNLHGNTGSIFFAASVTILSHNKKPIHSIPEMVKRVMTNGDSHGYLFPASSRAATRRRVAPRSIKVPGKSTRSNADFDFVARAVRDLGVVAPWKGNPDGKDIRPEKPANTPAGTLDYCQTGFICD